MNEIIKPLRLAVGSHVAGSGKGCAMNVISWEAGESTISDMPACADPMLAKIVQRVNDTHCSHAEGGLLCPPCSVEVLELAHRTVGSALDMSPKERARIYVEIAVEEAESVLGLTTSEAPRRACALVRRWLAGEDISRDQLLEARRAADYAAITAAYAADAYAITAAAYAAYAADDYAAADAAAYAAAYAADADAYAADADAYARRSTSRLDRAHRIIDRFEQITGVKAQQIRPEVVQAAVCKMYEVAGA